MVTALAYHQNLIAKIKGQIEKEEARYELAIANKDSLATIYLDHANGLKTTLHYVEVWSPQTLELTAPQVIL